MIRQKYSRLSREGFKQYVEEAKLRELPRILHKIEKRIYLLVKSGEQSHSNIMKRMRLKRNFIRNELFKKLKEWKKDPHVEEIISYSEVLEIEEKKKLAENYEKPTEE